MINAIWITVAFESFNKDNWREQPDVMVFKSERCGNGLGQESADAMALNK